MALWRNDKQYCVLQNAPQRTNISNEAMNWRGEDGIWERGERSGNLGIYCLLWEELGCKNRVVDLWPCSSNIRKSEGKKSPHPRQGERRDWGPHRPQLHLCMKPWHRVPDCPVITLPVDTIQSGVDTATAVSREAALGPDCRPRRGWTLVCRLRSWPRGGPGPTTASSNRSFRLRFPNSPFPSFSGSALSTSRLSWQVQVTATEDAVEPLEDLKGRNQALRSRPDWRATEHADHSPHVVIGASPTRL